MPKRESKFGKPPSCWNSEHAYPRPESDFYLTPPPRNSVTAVECSGDGGTASASGLRDNQIKSLLGFHLANRVLFAERSSSRRADGAYCGVGVRSWVCDQEPGLVQRRSGVCDRDEDEALSNKYKWQTASFTVHVFPRGRGRRC